MAKQISVVIPSYNRSGFIKDAVDSVLNQKGALDLDIVVVDDGSTDDTEAVLKPYHKKIRYFKLPHSGLPAVARNFGIAKARGELIAFQDSDDQWPLDKLSLEAPIFDDPKVIMTYGHAKIMDSGGKISSKNVVAPSKLKNGESFSSLIKENVVSTLTVMVRKDALEAVGGFNESERLRAVEDYELWLRLAAKYPKGLRSIDKILAYYRVHDSNISSADDSLSVERLINVYDCMWENRQLTDAQRASLENQIFAMQENWSRLKNEAGEQPPISVVMGIYKDEVHVRKAIQSILEQTYPNFEFIIIDDGSQDKSAEIAASFEDPRIRIIHQVNHGLVYTLNQGVKLARAELIARMDADDISLPSRFEKELAWITADSRRGVVGSFFAYIDEKTSSPTGTVITSPTKHIDLWRNMYFNNPIGHGSTLIRRQAIIEAGGYRDNYGPNEDYDLWRRIVQNWEIGQIPEVLYWYRLSSGGISSTKQKLQHKLFAELVRDIWKGPIVAKSVKSIVKDAYFYAHLDSQFKRTVYHQYVDHQARLAFEFLIHGRLRTGYKTAFSLLFLKPSKFIRLWKILLWAPIKLKLGRSE